MSKGPKSVNNADNQSEYPLVSIGMPVFNGARYLREAIEGLLNQDYPNIEIILCDDHSTDGTLEIADYYSRKDRRLRYVRNEKNLGAAANFNRALALSEGEFFMWAAFDDVRYPQYLSKCVTALLNCPDAVMCCTDVRIIDAEGREFPPDSYITKPPAGNSADERVDALTRAFNWVDVYSLIRRTCLTKTRGFLPVFGGDVILILELCLQGQVLHLPEKLWAVRIFLNKTASEQVQTLVATGTRSVIVSYTDLAGSFLRVIIRSNVGPICKWKLFIRSLWNTCRANVKFRSAIIFDSTEPLSRAFREKRSEDIVYLFFIKMLMTFFRGVDAAKRFSHGG